MLPYLLSPRHLVTHVTRKANMERLGNERLEAETARVWDNVKVSDIRKVSICSTDSPAQQKGSSSKRTVGRREVS